MEPGVYDLTLYNGDCQETALTAAFTVTAECITPTVTFESDSPVELGQPMHFVATVPPTIPVTYAWDFGGPGYGIGEYTATPIYTYTDSSVFTVTVTAKNRYCQATVTAGQAVEVTCYEPEADIVSNSPVVLGEPMAFTAIVTGTRPLTYTWDFGGPGYGSGMSTATPVYTYIQAGDYVVALTVEGPCGSTAITEPVSVVISFQYVYLPVVVKSP